MSTLLPVRFSSLKLIGKSPAHYAWSMITPRVETKAMRFGSALDALLFGTNDVRVFEGASRRGKAWTEFADANPEAVLLLASEQEIISGMLQSVQGNKVAMDLLTGARQQRIEWTMNGRACSGTPDVFTKGQLVELKSTRNANPDWFQYDARKLAYHAQLAWYRNGLSSPDVALCEPNARCFIVSVESSPPYPVTILELTPKAIEEGNKLWRLWFERLLVCEASNAWPAYTEAIVPFDAPDTDSFTLKIEGEDVEV